MTGEEFLAYVNGELEDVEIEDPDLKSPTYWEADGTAFFWEAKPGRWIPWYFKGYLPKPITPMRAGPKMPAHP